MPNFPTGDIDDAPLEEFVDPQSAIASILNQMTGAAQRSRPTPYDPFSAAEHQGMETVENANRPMPTNANPAVEDLIRLLMQGGTGGRGPLDLTAFYGR